MSQMDSNSKPTNNSRELGTYHPILSESIDRFLAEYRNGATDFSNFSSIFSRLLHNSPDPPLEVVWFYSALTFHADKSTVQDPSQRVCATKGLFQLLSSCSCSCNAVTKAAALAPVVYELCCLLSEEKCSKSEAESLLEGVISYISLCNTQEAEEDYRLSSHFVDLLGVWMVDRIGESNGVRIDYFRAFFPIISEEVRGSIVLGCGVGYLAGVVMCEAFLLRLCLMFEKGLSKMEVEKNAHHCAVQMITGVRSLYLLDVLLKMLLEPVLPVNYLLGPENEVFLREVLYDAVITVEYSFFNPGGRILLSNKQLTNLALMWLCVADSAIQFVRENSNQTKLFSYLTAFSKSCLPSQLLKWVSNQAGMEEAGIRNLSTPASLIKWLLIVQDQGLEIFESDICKIYAKAVVCKPTVEYNIPAVNLAAPGLLKSTPINGVRKREEGSKVEGQKPFKCVKFASHDNSMIEKLFPLVNDGGLSSGSEVDNPVSDEDMQDIGGMEDMEQEILIDTSS
ncbi:hypothetical protein SLE2022_148590 [Rubroshorea leprosula]